MTSNITHVGSTPTGRYQLVCACGAGFTSTPKEYQAGKWSEGCPKCQHKTPTAAQNYRPLYIAPDRPLDDYQGIRIGRLVVQKLAQRIGNRLILRVHCEACNTTTELSSRAIFSRRAGMGVLTDCGCTSTQEAAQRALRAVERKKARKDALKEQAAVKAARAQARDLVGHVYANFEVVRPATKREAKKGSGIGCMWVIQCRICQTTYVRSTAIIKRLTTTHCGKCRPAPRTKKVNMGRKQVRARG